MTNLHKILRAIFEENLSTDDLDNFCCALYIIKDALSKFQDLDVPLDFDSLQKYAKKQLDKSGNNLNSSYAAAYRLIIGDNLDQIEKEAEKKGLLAKFKF